MMTNFLVDDLNRASCAAIFQGRLWLAGTSDKPTEVYASDPENWNNFNPKAVEFTEHTPIRHAIRASFDARITKLVPHRDELYAVCFDCAYRIRSGAAGPVTAYNFTVDAVPLSDVPR